MTQQAEFLKNVRETFTKAQSNATQRIGELVEKGKASQKDLSERIAKLDLTKVAPADMKAKVEELQKRVKTASETALTYVDSTGRTQAANVASELRKLADRLEKLSAKPAVEAPAVH